MKNIIQQRKTKKKEDKPRILSKKFQETPLVLIQGRRIVADTFLFVNFYS